MQQIEHIPFGSDSLETLDKDRRGPQNPGDTFVSNTRALPTPDHIRAHNASFYSTVPKESFYSGVAMSKSAFDTGFKERTKHSNNLSQQQQPGEPLSKSGMPLQVTADRSFYNRGSELSFKEAGLPMSKDEAEARSALQKLKQTGSSLNVPLPPSHAVGERDLASKNNGTVSKLITV